jgi:hypothetical protein
LNDVVPHWSDTPLTFVCFKWVPLYSYRSKFDHMTVNVLHSMLNRHYLKPFELVCVTDDPAGIVPQVRIVKLWDDHTNVVSPHGPAYPSCYRRLKMFSSEAREILGARVCSIDLDVVICREITGLFEVDVDFKVYGDTAVGTPYNGSLIYHWPGRRTQLWDRFDPRTSPGLGRKLKYIGSDQAWIAACLGPDEAKFTKADGVYSYRNEIVPKGGGLPAGARIVVMHGWHDPWDPQVRQRHPWIVEHYR